MADPALSRDELRQRLLDFVAEKVDLSGIAETLIIESRERINLRDIAVTAVAESDEGTWQGRIDAAVKAALDDDEPFLRKRFFELLRQAWPIPH